jgi:hypothetical protein
MESSESIPIASWDASFPRLFEIYALSNRVSPGNWFQLPNVWRGLVDNSGTLQRIEAELQQIDAASWVVFKRKAAQRVHLIDKWGYSRDLFDCLYDIKGYRYLISQGYEQVRFLPEQTKVKTPDLRAHAALSTIVMEVKTVHESNKQKHYFEIPGEQRIALETEYHLSRALKAKLNSAIQVARTQLLAVQDPTVIRRIVYLVIRPDFHIEAHEELEIFLQTQSTSEIEVIHHLLG